MSKSPNRFVPSGKLKALELREGSSIPVSNALSGRIRYNEVTNHLELSENTGAFASILGTEHGIVTLTPLGGGADDAPQIAAAVATGKIVILAAGTWVRGAVTRTSTHAAMFDPSSGVHNVEFYGALGTGLVDDTVAIQAAIAAGVGKTVSGRSGATYLLTEQGVKSNGATNQHYCLSLPSHTTMVLTGCTLKLADGENSAMVCNETLSAATNHDITIVGPVTLDGNQANQTAPASGEMPLLLFYEVAHLDIDGVNATNAREYFGRFLGCTDSRFDALHGELSFGDGWNFGNNVGTWQTRDSTIGSVWARDCRGTYGASQGNPFLGTFIRCNVGQVYGDNCKGGIKIQDGSSDSNFGEMVYVGGANSTNNSGIKIQGTDAPHRVERINVDSIAASYCYAEGLVVNHADDVSIGQYAGEYNDAGAGAPVVDVCLEESLRTSIGTLSSSHSHGVALLINTAADQWNIGRVNVYNCADGGVAPGTAVQIVAAGGGRIETITAIDDRGGSFLMNRILSVPGTSYGSVGTIRTNLPQDAGWSSINIVAGNYTFSVDRVELNNGQDPVFGVVTLANAVSTVVANGSVWSTLSGGVNIWHSLVEIIPWSASAMALGAMRVVPVDFTAGTGFVIHHAAAAGTELVAYRVHGGGTVVTTAA
jgi:hypothetical protein